MRYQSSRTRRQFLSGVKCPNCHSLDTVVQIQVFEPSPDEYIECTECQYQERRPTAESVQHKNAMQDAKITNAGISVVSITNGDG